MRNGVNASNFFADNGICIKEGGTTNAPSMRCCSLPLSFNAMLAADAVKLR
jgi:hypothetical protein